MKSYEFAEEKLKLASEHMKRRYDTKADYSVFVEGDAMAVQPTEQKKGVSKAKQTLDWTLCYQKEDQWSGL